MRAAIYARKSQKQEGVPENATSVGRQVEGARAFITGKGWTLDEAHVYEDKGKSGALFLARHRPEFQRMMRDAEADAFGAIVFYDLDRFGRAKWKMLDALRELTIKLGIEVWDYSTGQAVDLVSPTGAVKVMMGAIIADEEHKKHRKRTRDGMRHKATIGQVWALPYGYHSAREMRDLGVGRINEQQAAIVRDIYERFANGQGINGIVRALNVALVPTGRRAKKGWAVPVVRKILKNPTYRGYYRYGTTANRWGEEELGKRVRKNDGEERERAQLPQSEETWIRQPYNAELCIIEPELAARVDARYLDLQTRAQAARQRLASLGPQKEGKEGQKEGEKRGKRVKPYAKYLLSKGMLICPDCGGHFEARPHDRRKGVYICATRRRSPGRCSNRLALPIEETDNRVLSVIEDEVLGNRFIGQLLALLDDAPADDGARLEAERNRLCAEIDHLLEVVAAGVPAATAAPKIREREAEIARIEARLRLPRPVRPDKERLRAALEMRTAVWRAELRAEPKVAGILLRRLIGPLTVDTTPVPDFIRERYPDVVNRLVPVGTGEDLPDEVWWQASTKPTALLEGLAVDGQPLGDVHLEPSRR